MGTLIFVLTGWKLPVEEASAFVQVGHLTATAATAGTGRAFLTTGSRTGFIFWIYQNSDTQTQHKASSGKWDRSAHNDEVIMSYERRMWKTNKKKIKVMKRTKYFLLTLAIPCKYLHKSSESVKFKGPRCSAL